MTLNQVIKRIKTISLAHKQIRAFRVGIEQDLFADKKAKYPACCLMYDTGSISISQNLASISFRMMLLDMVNVSSDAKENEDEVLSDLYSVMLDLVAQINASVFADWRISAENNMQAVVEHENDMLAGWAIDFSIRTIFTQNRCEIPSDIIDDLPSADEQDMKPVFDLEYIAPAANLTTLAIPTIAGKKILLIIREGNPIHKVSSNPDPAEYTWDNTDLVLGVPTSKVGERFLILYRNY